MTKIDAIGYFQDQVRLIIVKKMQDLEIKDKNGNLLRKILDLNAYADDSNILSMYMMEMVFVLFFGTFDIKKR